MPGLSVGLVTPTSLLGRDLKAVLKERAFPVSQLHLFHTGGSVEGLVTSDDDEAVYVAPLTPDALDTSSIAFFCGDAEGSARFYAARTDACLAIDLSGVRTGGPFVSPSQEGPLPAGNLYLTYDPTAALLADLVARLDALRPVTALTVAVDRPVSELGVKALDELFQQAISLASFKPLPKDVLGTQSAFNVHRPADSDAFEARVVEDLDRLLGRSLPATVLSSRVGVFHGHHLRVEARFDGEAPSVERIREVLFAKGSGFDDVDPEDLSGPVESAGRDEALVLSIASSGGSARLHLASDHLRRGGAVMAVRLAERAAAERKLV